jgi:hypothetical protein
MKKAGSETQEAEALTLSNDDDTQSTKRNDNHGFSY